MTDTIDIITGKKILLATGGSGGHVSPALAVAEALRIAGAHVALSYDERTASLIESEEGYHFCALPLQSRKPGLLGKLKLAAQLARSFFKSLCFIRRFKPDLIIGFGGAASSPLVVIAMILGRPLMIHEQNSVLGQVNRFASRSALALALSFPNTRRVPPKDAYKSVLVGNPVRPAFQALATRSFPALNEEEPVHLLVLAGSQGASFLDRCVSEALTKLPEPLRKRLVVHQQVREEHIPLVQHLYESHAITHTVAPYFKDVPTLMKSAHLVLARSGSSTVFELMAAGQPAVLIPLPTSKDNHQKYNAEAFQELGGGLMLDQKDLTPKKLASALVSVLLYPHLMVKMHESLVKSRKTQATEMLLELIRQVLNRREGASS